MSRYKVYIFDDNILNGKLFVASKYRNDRNENKIL